MSSMFVRYSTFVANGHLQGRLYDVGLYPAAIESTQRAEKVYGEIYRIKNRAILTALDKYEGCSLKFPEPREYRRKKLSVRTVQGTELFAWVYVYNRDVSMLKRIQSGDYLR